MKESILRTLVPIIYALLIKAGAGSLGVDDAVIQSLAGAVGAGLIYIAVRVGERVGSSRWGWLIGYPSAPRYDR